MSDKLMIKGKLIKKFEPQTFGESFRKMVIQKDGVYRRNYRRKVPSNN